MTTTGDVLKRTRKFFPKIGAALDAPALLNGAIKRGDFLSEPMCAKTADGLGWLVIYFHPADPMDRPDIDTFEIKLLAPQSEGHWYVDIWRERDPRRNGEVEAVSDGRFDDVPPADKDECQALLRTLQGAVLVEKREATQEVREAA